MKKTAIRKNQMWRHKHSGDYVLIKMKHGDKWVIELKDKPRRNGTNSHSVSPTTLWTKFELIV